MSKYRPVDIRLWNDRKFLDLSADGRLLWIFLLTAPNTLPIPGVVIGGSGTLSEQLGWSLDRLERSFNELFHKQLSIRREGRLIWLPNALKYQPPRNPNMVKGWASTWDDIPETNLKLEIWEALKITCKSWDKLFGRLFQQPSVTLLSKQDHQEQEQEQEQDQKQEQDLEDSEPLSRPGVSGLLDAIHRNTGDVGLARAKQHKPRKPKRSDPTESEAASVRVVLGKLGAANDVKYSGAEDHIKLIVGRLREGVTELELRAVIGYCAFELGWKTKPEMQHNLRPETLFGPRTISRYLDPARTWAAREYPDEFKQAEPAQSSLLTEALAGGGSQ